MPDYKIKVYFRDGGTCAGWSHAFYAKGVTLDQARKKATDLAKAITEPMAYAQPVVRLTVQEFPGRRGIIEIPYADLSFVLANDGVAVPPWEGVRLTWQDSSGNKSIMHFKGVPDSEVFRKEAESAYTISPGLRKRFDTLIGTVRSLDLYFPVTLQPPAVATVQVNDITYNSQTSEYTLTVPAHGLTTGSMIFVLGDNIADWECIRGRRRIFVVDDNTFQIRATVPCDARAYQGGVEYFPIQTTLSEIQSGFIGGVFRSKSGASYGLRTGRRSTRNRKCLPCIGIATSS